MSNTQAMSPIGKLEGKVAIVTGGASGIGEATARLFAQHGARAVVIVDIQVEKGQSVAKSIGSQLCSYVNCDVTEEEQVKAAVDWTVTTYGRLDIMFSNAGTISNTEQTILDLDLPKYDRLMQINARGMAICVKQAARKMIEHGIQGAIVCTSSVAATMGGLNFTDYIMSKNAVLGLMRSSSVQLGKYGIRVNCVSPSAVVTPLAGIMGLGTAVDVENIIGPFTSLKGDALTTTHVAKVVLFLASDDSAFVTGHNMVVDGGLISLPFLKTE
ncbi:hypothetical protein ACJIZ3_003396 [Penstemon smallii]|uniref:Uncharacterized protein n=1 Tax=Penstemon smallii TaxID=265156 RepID=A0ABD3UBT2_9LAMI